MVIEDLSQNKKGSQSGRLAPVSDRVLSVLLDLTLFSPLFSLLLSGLLRKLQYRYFAAPESTEFWILAGLTMFGYSALTVFSQGLFWAVAGATPGQFFFQLRVLRTKDRKFLTLRSAWLRSLLFWGECLCLGLPFLEVFSHADRRMFHDRATESEVVTLKAVGVAGPQPLETRVIHAFFTVCIAFALTWVMAMVSHLYRRVNAGSYKEAELTEADYLCEGIPEHDEGGRLDAAIAMYKTGVFSAECLASDIDFAFWKGENPDQAWASLGMAILNENDASVRSAYLEQACEKDAEGAACRLSRWWGSEGSSDENIPGSPQSWTRAVLALERLEKKHDLPGWERQLSDLPSDFDLNEFIESQRIKLLWVQNKVEQARGGYQVLFDQLSEPTQRSLSSELCFSELTSGCTIRNFKFCRDLDGTLSEAEAEEIRPEWLVALAEENSCRRVPDTGLLMKAAALDPESDWGRLLSAILPESGWNEVRRLSELRKLAFSESTSKLLKSRAFVQLLRTSKDPTDLEKGQALLAQKELPFQSEIRGLFTQTAQRMGFEKIGTPKDRLPASAREEP